MSSDAKALTPIEIVLHLFVDFSRLAEHMVLVVNYRSQVAHASSPHAIIRLHFKPIVNLSDRRGLSGIDALRFHDNRRSRPNTLANLVARQTTRDTHG